MTTTYTFEQLKEDVRKEAEALRVQLESVQSKIKKLEGVRDITDRIAAYFHLGMVGGSGKNTHKLNKKRETSIEITIERAKILTILYAQENALTARIVDIERGGPQKRENAKKAMAVSKAEYWKGLKKGDKVELYTGNEIAIQKKNRKSIVSDNCIWKAEEIIGKEAAKLL